MPHTATAPSRPRAGAGGCLPPHPGKEKAGPEREGCILETWHRRRGNALTLAAFQAAGGFEGALAQTA
ncbi:hypothetical protein ABZ445_34760, partial [Streptomyces chartreusis]|uniref:hypothetical protein n=1 Tax=Streptomyces chartreusis TaxID=1969 RepID=UPI0033D9E788